MLFFKRGVLFALTALAALAPSLSLKGQQAELDSEAIAPLRSAMERISQADTLGVQLNSELLIRAGEEVLNEQKLQYRSQAASPAQYIMDAKIEDMQLDVIANNDQGLFFLVNSQNYLKLESADDFSEILDVGIVPMSPIGPLLFVFMMPDVDNFQRLTENAKNAELVESDDDAPQHVRLDVEDLQWNFFITRGSEPAIERIEIDLTDQLKSASPQAAAMEGLKGTIELTFTEWDFDAAAAADTFSFEPPENADAYESLEALQLAMSGQGPHPLLGKEAPTFQAAMYEGDVMNLERHRGKDVVILDFWATWCGPCRIAMPIIGSVATELKDEGVVLYAVNVQQSEEEIKEFLEESELELPVALDSDGEISSKYRVTGIPQTVLIGKDGIVQKVHVGFRSEEQLRRDLISELTTLSEGGSLLPEDDSEESAPAENASASSQN